MPIALGVIGLGRMAQALVIPLIEQELISADEVIAVVGRAGLRCNGVCANALWSQEL